MTYEQVALQYYSPWQIKGLAVALKVKGNVASVTVTGPGISDVLTWPVASGFAPTLLKGQIGGKAVEVTERDVAPKK